MCPEDRSGTRETFGTLRGTGLSRMGPWLKESRKTGVRLSSKGSSFVTLLT